MATVPPFDADTASPRSSALLHRNWGWLVVRGVLALVLAVIAFLFPLNAVFAFTMVFAAYAGADGVLSLIAGIRGATHHDERWGSLILRGVAGIAVAALFLVMPGVATLSWAYVAAGLVVAWAILTGLFEIVAAVRLRREIKGEWMLALSGLLSLLLGLWIWWVLWTDPLVSLLSVGWAIGVWAVVAGVALIALGLRLRGLQAGVAV